MSRKPHRRLWTIPALALLSCLGQPDGPLPGANLTKLPDGTRATLEASASLRTSASLLRKRHLKPAMRRFPIFFEANEGQTDPRYAFVSRRAQYSLHLSSDHVSVLMDMTPPKKRKPLGTQADAQDDKAAPAPPAKELRISLSGARSGAQPVGLEPQPGKVNYLIGRDPSQWKTNIATYGAVGFEGVYPGIDLIYHARQDTLEYDFVVAPGADPSVISLKAHGHERLEVGKKGNLRLRVGDRDLVHQRPVAYQLHGDEHRPVEAAFVRRSDGTFGFEIGAYDRSKPLVVDPPLHVASYFGGAAGSDSGSAIATDAAGAAYVMGSTYGNLPVTSAVGYAGNSDLFVAKFDFTLASLIYATYLGSAGNDYGSGIAVDSSGRPHIAGYTNHAPNFPVTANALQSTAPTPPAFYSVLSADGNSLEYSTLLHSGELTYALGIALDSTGAAHISGYTSGSSFPTAVRGGFSQSSAGQSDAFLAVIDIAALQPLRYLTLLGGSGHEFTVKVAVDRNDRTIVAGYTGSSNFPTANAVQPNKAGGSYDAFVVKLHTAVAGAASLLWSTYLGGSLGDEYVSGVATDGAGSVFVTGSTSSTNYPVTTGAYQETHKGSSDVFLSKLDANGAVIFSTFLGGALNDYANGAIAADGRGNVFVGFNTSSVLDVSATCPIQTAAGTGVPGYQQPYLIALNPSGTAPVYRSYLGTGETSSSNGPVSSNLAGIAIFGADVLVTGTTNSDIFPVTAGAYDTTPPTPPNSADAYVMRVLAPLGCGVVTPPPGSLAQGALCASGADCATGLYCVDGVCCDTECSGGNGDCMGCSLGAGAALDGYCVKVADLRVCRPSSSVCDSAEVCNGTTADCPPDTLATAGTVCRPATGPCDLQETCDGASASCPPDLFAAAGATCRSSTGACDPAETCAGGTAYCPSDVNAAADFLERVSVTTAGAPFSASTNASSRYVSDTGRYAVVTGADGTVRHRDRHAGTTRVVSVTPGGASRDGYFPSISPDGRYVTFTSGANDLVAFDGNPSTDVFLRDTCAGATGACTETTALISVATDGAPSDYCDTSAVSAGGRFVAFACRPTNWPEALGNEGVRSVFRRDTCMGAPLGCVPETILVSKRPLATGGSLGSANYPTIDATGRFVAYTSDSSYIVDRGGAYGTEGFLADLTSDTTTWLTARGTATSAYTEAVFLSSNGRFAAYALFESGPGRVWIADTCHGATGCTPSTDHVSLTYTGAPASGSANYGSVSDDGRFVAFMTADYGLLPPPVASSQSHIYVRDRVLNVTTRVSQVNDTTPANAYSESPSISANGAVVMFGSYATNLAPGGVSARYVYARGNSNRAPTVEALPDQTVTICGTLVLNVPGMDTCTPALTYHVSMPQAFVPTGPGTWSAQFNSATGTFTMDPVAAPPGTYTVSFHVSDGTSMTTRNVQIIVQAAGTDTFTVSQTADSGAGSLRHALWCANANPGPDKINFAIPGAGPHTIVAQDLFAAIETTQPVTLDGTTQPGYTGTPLIEIDGNQVGTNGQPAFLIYGPGSIVRGLAVNNWKTSAFYVGGANVIFEGNHIGVTPTGNVARGNSGNGIWITSGGSGVAIGGAGAGQGNVISGNGLAGVAISGNVEVPVTLRGNRIGTNAAGTAALGNANGVNVSGGPVTIGGTAAGERNLISGNTTRGIELSSSQGTVITGNYIGTDATGNGALPNPTGIYVGIAGSVPAQVTIGGANAGNVITASTGAAINAAGTTTGGFVIQGNLIGVGADGATPLPVGGSGIEVTNGNWNIVIGGVNSGEGNVIAHTGALSLPGVFVASSSSYGNLIRGNRIFDSGGLAIDLGAQGAATNDNLDADTGANRGQNHPVVHVAVTKDGATTITGSVNSKANTTYQIDLYASAVCDASGYGEAEIYLGATSVTTNASGNGSFTFGPSTSTLAPLGFVVVGTATDIVDGTSELSGCRVVVESVPNVSIDDVNVAEGASAGFTVTLSAAASTPIDVTWATANGTATAGAGAGADYTSASGTLTFLAGQTSKTITINTLPDAIFEGNETFFVNLGIPGGALVTKPQGIATILDDDPKPTLSIANNNTTEGNSGTKTLSFTVTLTPAPALPVTVDYATADGTATVADGDYAATSGTLTFTAGQTSKTISVTINGDGKVEPTETFSVTLSNAANATISGTGTATGTINNDDTLLVLTNPGNKSIGFCAPLTFVLSASGGVSPRTFTATSGMPAGATLTAGGSFSWTPAVADAGVYTVTFRVTDSTGNIDQKTITITASASAAGVITVNLATDSGVGTLRWAIECANARTGTVTVELKIGTGPQSIELATPLPVATTSLAVDGTKQSGYATGGAPMISLKPGVSFATPSGSEPNGLTLTAGGAVHGLSITGFPGHGIRANTLPFSVTRCYIGLTTSGQAAGNGGDGIRIEGTSNTTIGSGITGFRNVIGGNAGYGIHLLGSTQSIVIGNYIGTNPAGTLALANGLGGIRLENGGYCQIGDGTATGRNVISGNGGFGVRFDGTPTNANALYRNTIGLNRDENAALPNAAGVFSSQNAQIGGAGYGNVIAGNTGVGIRLDGSQLGTVLGNHIGRTATGVAFGNGGAGIEVVDSNGVTIGSTGTGANAITGNGGAGVSIAGTSTNVKVRLNSIHGNAGLGIDLGAPGVALNDPLDVDSGPNGLVNYPAVAAAEIVGATISIAGTWSGPAGSTSVTIDLFENGACDPSGHGEGQTLLGTTTVTSNASGSASFSVTLTKTVAEGQFVTATATTTQGTSEFSPCTVATAAPRTLSIAGTTLDESDTGTTATFVVTLNTPKPSNVTVSYTTVDGTALAGSDYTQTSGSLTLLPGQVSANISVPILGDTDAEPDETFTVQLSSPSGATIAQATAIGTIVNDDFPSISVNSPSVVEGNSGTTTPLVFTVTLSPAPVLPVTVDYTTVDGTATVADGDYVTESGTLNFATGETSKTISVTINGDGKGEASETVAITLSNAVNGTLSSGSALGTILNDDVVAPATLSISDVSLLEGDDDDTSFDFVVTRSGDTSTQVSVNYATSDGSADSLDYLSATGTLTIPVGSTSETISILVYGDMAPEEDKTFNVTLSNPSGATIVKVVGVGTIRDNDGVTATITGGQVAEGASGVTSQLVFTVTLSKPRATSFYFYDAGGGTATPYDDYDADFEGELVFDGLSTTQTFSVAVYGNDTETAGPDKTVKAYIESTDSSVYFDNDDIATVATGTIVDDDGTACTGTVCGANCCTGSMPHCGAGDTCVQCTSATQCPAAPTNGTATCSSGVCGFTCNADSCSIGGNCVGDGAPNPTNTCQACSAITNSTGWSAANENGACNDNNACTSNDVCNAQGQCAGTPVNVDDSDQCTTDACNPATGVVTHTISTGAPCNDSNLCTTNDLCNAQGQCAGTAVSVDDSDQCTADACNPATGVVTHTISTGAPCNDSNLCTTNDLCNAQGQCAGTAVSVDDSDQCTADACNPATGVVTHTISTGAPCNDSNLCTTNDLCNAQGQCSGTAVSVDDSDQCTADACNPATGMVTHTISTGAPCNDSNLCTTNDLCNAQGQCAGTAVSVDDSDQCTADACNPATGVVTHTISTGAPCNDSNLCTTNDLCNAQGQCAGTAVSVDDSDQCTADACNPATGVVTHTISTGAPCNDSNLCTTNDLCNAQGQCSGTAVSVDDSDQCTADACNPATGVVTHTISTGAPCNDSNLCTSSDLCNAQGLCVGTPVNVDDSDQCTTDACNSATGVVTHTISTGAPCNDSNLCTTNDLCNAQGQCAGTAVSVDDSDQCTADACNPATGVVTHTISTGAPCNDSNLCTTNDLCNAQGQCSGTAVSVDDSDQCTADACNPATGVVTHTISTGAPCNDSNLCTTNDLCNAQGQCAGTAVSVDDSDQCTTDACNPATGVVTHTISTGAPCNDSNLCTTNDLCNAQGQCSGTAVSVDDSDQCTADACNPATGVVTHTISTGAPCNDSNLCTTNDLCNAQGQCAGTAVSVDDSDQCTADACNPATGVVTHTISTGAPCNDSNLCTTNDLCNAQGQCSGTAVSVDDSDQCTADACNPATGVVTHTISTGAPCNDSNLCTTNDLCNAQGQCAGTAVSVDDSDQCTADACNPATGVVTHTISTGAPCNDSNLCTTNDLCNAQGQCAGTAVSVDDSDQCTADACNPATGVVTHTISTGAPCNDSNLCTTNDLCNAQGQCAGTAVSVDDSDQCTADACNPATGVVTHTISTGAPCNDSNLCTTNDFCNAQGLCAGTAVSVDDSDQCTADACNPATGVVTHTISTGAPCNDSNLCTTNDLCNAQGQCSGTAVSVDDSDQCTADACNPATGVVTHTISTGAPCNDSNLCTTNDLCNAQGQCAGTAVSVDDSDQCTADACNPATGVVTHTISTGAPCNDSNLCTTNDLCNAQGQCSGTAVSVDDSDQCTADACNPATGVVTHTISTGAPCNDSNLCTTNDLCNAQGQCAGTAVSVDDSDQCTADACNPATGVVTHTISTGAPCNDSNLCTSSDLCNAQGQCAGTAVSVDDSDQCTADACNPATGVVTHTISTGAPCNDSNLCTTNDLCNAQGQCAGTAVSVDDSDQCTADACNPATGVVTHTISTGAPCNDSNLCTTNDLCNAQGQCSGTAVSVDDSDQCTADACNPATGVVTHTISTGAPCNDSNLCTTNDLCNAQGQCAGTAVSVDDSDQCTADACNPATGVVTHTISTGAPCNDSNLCTSSDLCNAQGLCVGTPVNVDDSDQCTTDACNSATGVVTHTISTGAPCNDSNLCTTNDLCNAQGQCAGTAVSVDDSDQCTADACNPATGVVTHTISTGAPCNDSNLCTTNDLCNAQGQCAGTAVSVDDSDQCTADACNPATGVVTHTISTGAPCNDSNLCTTNDLCNAQGQCSGTAVSVDDSDQCTADACNPATGVVTHTISTGAPCNDSNLCTTNDLCNAQGQCSGTAVSVDDSDQCTADACNPATGVVTHTISTGASCNDGSLCTTNDLCNAQGLCVGTPVNVDDSDQCTTDACDPVTGISHTPLTNGATCDDGDPNTYPDTCQAGICVGNHAPVAVGDSYSVNEDTTLSVLPGPTGLLANDSDPDVGDSLTAVVVTNPSHGILVLFPTGGFDYTPSADYSGPDSFTYKASDGDLDSAWVTVSITVKPVNDAPTGESHSYMTAEEVTLNVPASEGLLVGAADEENDFLTAHLLAAPMHGAVDISADGSFEYTPALNFYGTDTFTYRVWDGSDYSQPATVTLQVTNVNDAPVARDDGATTNAGISVTVPVLANDTDPEGSPLVVIYVQPAPNGVVELLTTGQIRYTPNAGFVGVDTFSYQITDTGNLTATAIVTIVVSAQQQSGRMTGGGSVFTSAGVRVTHGFVLRCGGTPGPNRLEINWGRGNRFHLESLQVAACSDAPGIDPGRPDAWFDTLAGSGTGRLNGTSGAVAEWRFTDQGEPGRNDTVALTIRNVSGAVVLEAAGRLRCGNHQAHAH